MGFIHDELQDVRTRCERNIPGSKIISCLPISVRVHITISESHLLVICIQFPAKYPHEVLLVELKSKTLSDVLLSKLVLKVEEAVRKYIGKAQVIEALKFLYGFFQQSLLYSCYDEIQSLKNLIRPPGDELKLKQKSSTIVLAVKNGEYFCTAKVTVPQNYPKSAAKLVEFDTNFPPVFERHLIAQATEIARQCVEPPLRRTPKQPAFVVQPSVYKALSFVLNSIKKLPNEFCQFCDKQCFPQHPKDLILDENDDNHIERNFCGHLFHQGCLVTYLRTPPFGSKQCKACGMNVSHHKWSVSDKLAEDRWAHEKARERELTEVQEFFT